MTARATTSAPAAQRLREHLLAALLCPERATVTNLLCTSGRQHEDWSAAYRLYARDRVEEGALFAEVCAELTAHLAPQAPLVVALDDTLVRKRGTHIDGVAWRRDPLGPHFQTNLVRGQRFLQFSAAWPYGAEGAARMVPIGFFHAPPAGKAPKEAGAAELRQHREEQKQRSLNHQSLRQMAALRARVDPARPLIFNGDGSYTNAMVLKGLPAGSTYIGRIRKDAKLHEWPGAPRAATGRRPSYGPAVPTPEALRTDEGRPWQQVAAFAAGQRHQFRLKTLGPVLWRKSGAALPLRVVVIAPLGYRLRAGAKLLYRQPAYLICSDPSLPLAELLQYYLWRWGIEVNFREEKTLLGAGQAQVRTAASNAHLPAVIVAAYALLWVSALRLHTPANPANPGASCLQPPKWRPLARAAPALPSTGDLLRTLRFETWAGALRPGTFYDFVTPTPPTAKPQKLDPSLPGALFATA